MTTFTAPIKRADKLAAAEKPREYNVIEQAIIALSGVCDGAHTRDGQGFNGTDSQFGKSLAVQLTTSSRGLSYKQATGAIKMLKKYSKQLKGLGLVPPTVEDYTRLYPYPYRVEVINNEIALFMPYPDIASIKIVHPDARFDTPDKSIRFPLSAAEKIWEDSPPEFRFSDEVLNLIMDCGF